MPEGSAEESATADDLPLIERQFNAARRELDFLLSRLMHESKDRVLGQEAATALATTLEELEVTAEELRAQNDELRETRHRSEQLQARYRSLFDLAPEAYLVTDEFGVVREANVQAERLLGRSHGELIGKPLALHVASDARSDFRRRVGRINELSLRGVELRLVTKSDDEVVVTASVAPMTLPGGERELRWVLADASPMLLVRDQMQQRLNDSAHDVLELETVRDWQSTLLGAAAHDLRTPLAVVAGVFETLLTYPELPVDQRTQMHQRGSGQASKLMRVLDGLLELGRRQLSADRVKRSTVNVADVIATVLDPVLLGDHHVHVHADLEAFVDPTQLERIIENLITNAIRHAPHDTEIEIWALMQDGDLLIRVDDHGPGVEDDLKDLVFQPFVAADRDERRRGSGLGLAIVAMFGSMHGGRAWVEDRPGGGASFRVLLADSEPA